MASVKPQTDSIVAHLAGVKGAVRDEAGAIAARARASLGGHYRTGATSIVVSREDTDVLVGMTDEHGAAAAIEFGGTRGDGATIQGLFILHRAAGLPGGP